MKVKCLVEKIEAIEITIPDRFRKLAVPHPWEHPELTDADYAECADIVAAITGYDWDEDADCHLLSVECVDNGEMMLEL